MFEYDRTDISEDIDTKKTDGLREFIICYYWYFFEINVKFKSIVYDGCHDMTQKNELQ